MRLDKFLWSVRLCKTRSKAAKICDSDQVKINGEISKPSKNVKVGDSIALRQNPIWKEFKVLDLPKSRVAAKLLDTLILEQTSKEDLEILKQVQESNRQARIQGFRGRPTKRDRRKLDDLWN